jgi:aerobic-type carbon monoxide dehydrogenase small subunit (CoxS/CutS family)
MISFRLNGKPQSVDVPGDTPVLWMLRDTLQLTGTKFGCGIAVWRRNREHAHEDQKLRSARTYTIHSGPSSQLDSVISPP